MRWGQTELIPLSDGTFRLDGGAMFGVVPKTLWSKRATPDDRNRIPLAMRPLLVRDGARNVLIDAGAGDKMGAKESEIYSLDRTHHLDVSLAEVGLTPGDIDVVIASHLHFDHAGGFTTRAGGTLAPRFPRAEYYVRRGEWDDAMQPHERNRASYLAENFVPLAEAGLLRFIEGDGQVVPGISAWRTGGHTMHHQILRIDAGGRTAIFAADLIPTVAHVDLPWIMGYDLYPMDTLAYKRSFLREAIEGEYVIFFEHDPAITAGVIRESGGRLRVDPPAGQF
jgi:glyoxylase-like metal-dependent hydrolase (beta-lactamase superfamily II)